MRSKYFDPFHNCSRLDEVHADEPKGVEMDKLVEGLKKCGFPITTLSLVILYIAGVSYQFGFWHHFGIEPPLSQLGTLSTIVPNHFFLVLTYHTILVFVTVKFIRRMIRDLVETDNRMTGDEATEASLSGATNIQNKKSLVSVGKAEKIENDIFADPEIKRKYRPGKIETCVGTLFFLYFLGSIIYWLFFSESLKGHFLAITVIGGSTLGAIAGFVDKIKDPSFRISVSATLLLMVLGHSAVSGLLAAEENTCTKLLIETVSNETITAELIARATNGVYVSIEQNVVLFIPDTQIKYILLLPAAVPWEELKKMDDITDDLQKEENQ